MSRPLRHLYMQGRQNGVEGNVGFKNEIDFEKERMREGEKRNEITVTFVKASMIVTLSQRFPNCGPWTPGEIIVFL